MNETPDILWRRIRDAERRAPTDQPRLLVVDEDVDARLLVRYMLRHEGRTDVATTAAGALRMARDAVYDGLVISLQLPDDTGLRVMKRLRSRPDYHDAPMVALTDHTLPGDRERLVQAGFDACVTRADQAAELPGILRWLLSVSRNGGEQPSEGRASEEPTSRTVPRAVSTQA